MVHGISHTQPILASDSSLASFQASVAAPTSLTHAHLHYLSYISYYTQTRSLVWVMNADVTNPLGSKMERNAGDTAKQINSPKKASENKRVHRFMIEIRSMVQLVQDVDFGPHVRSLRPTHKYKLEIPERVRGSMRGGVNLHIPIIWDDGVGWLIRIKLHCVVAFGMISPEVRRLTLESERETMLVLKKHGLSVPDVYGPVVVTNGMGFIVIECISGKPCSRPIHPTLSDEPLDRLIRQFALFQIKLSTLTFNSIGSLVPSPTGDGVTESSGRVGIASGVGPSVSLKFLNDHSPYFLGPFNTSGERYLANVNLMLSKVENGDRSLGHPAVIYLVHLFYRDIVKLSSRLWVKEEIMLRHADDRGDHILCDENGNLTGIIDWEWAVTSTKSDAFSAPMGLVDIVNFQTGSNKLSDPEEQLASACVELGRSDLALCVREGKLHQRLWNCIGSKPSIGKARGLIDAAHIDTSSPLARGCEVETLVEWCEGMIDQYRGDEVMRRLVGEDHLSWVERCAIKSEFEWVRSPT